MIDIHTHILPFVDDGARDISTSTEMAKISVDEGVEYIFATPHYIENEGYNSKAKNKEILEALKEELRENNIDIKVILGNEVYITPNIIDLIENEEVALLGDSNYLLIELPMAQIPMYLEDMIYEIKLKGITPIIAHPERYREVKNDPNILKKYIELGALAQLNLGSLTGHYGEDIRKTAEILVTHNMIHFIGTDAHSKTRRPPRSREAIEEMKTIIGEQKTEDLTKNNPMKIIKNEELEIEEVLEYEEKKGLTAILKRIFKI